MKSTSSGQLLLLGIPGLEIDDEFADFIRKIQPGGFILFGRNIRTPSQLRLLIERLRDLSEIEPIITIDQEGGRVSRLKLLGNEPPNARQLRERGDMKLVSRHGEITGKLLRLFGFNLNLCPVLDIAFDDDADNSLRGRCYGTDASEVINLAGAFNKALRSTGILSCGKHFPGYSSASSDPHHDLSALPRTRKDLDAHELRVFRHFATGENAVDSMMLGHIAFEELDPSGLPSSLSRVVTTQLLRDEMGFRGLVMTDDLDMGAVLKYHGFEEMIALCLILPTLSPGWLLPTHLPSKHSLNLTVKYGICESQRLGRIVRQPEALMMARDLRSKCTKLDEKSISSLMNVR